MYKRQSQYWVFQCRRSCKKAVQSCIRCKRFNSKPPEQPFAQLPAEIVDYNSTRAFEFVGVDYLGPIVTLPSQEKLYVLLFTCMKIRAVHLEVTKSLNTNDLFLAISRFISRRGVPKQIRSDNGKSFKSAAEKLGTTHGIEWKFNVEKSPWTGGVWERLVRSVKNCLKFALSSTRLAYEHIETLVIHIEAIINSRPLTY